MSVVIKCKCPSTTPAAQYQDTTYGIGMRVANKTEKGDQQSTDVRCTICNQVTRVPNSQRK